MPGTTASLASLQLVEFRKLRFHSFNSWNSKEASHESFVFTNHGCDLNVTICPKMFFSGKWSFRCGEKLACLRDGCGRRRSSMKCSRTAHALELMVPGDFSFL